MTRKIVTGDEKLNRRLNNLAIGLQRKATTKAARASLKPVRATARRNAPHDTGELERSIVIRAAGRRGVVGARVTTGQKTFKGETYYGGFQEYGWQAGPRGSSNRTEVEGFFYMLRAAQDKRQSALTIYRRVLGDEITRLATSG